MLNIISTKIIIRPPCNAIRGLGELYANGLRPEGRARSAGRQATRSPQGWPLQTHTERQPGPPVRALGEQGDQRPSWACWPTAAPRKLSRWHLGRTPAGVCGVWTCVLARLSRDWLHTWRGRWQRAFALVHPSVTRGLVHVTRMCAPGHGVRAHSWPRARRVTSRCLSFSICKWGPLATVQASRGGLMRVTWHKAQALVLHRQHESQQCQRARSFKFTCPRLTKVKLTFIFYLTRYV